MPDQDEFNLNRFVNAQESTYAQVRTEIAAGQKRSHWMWFIFPQVRGLGTSPMAQRFAISGLPEAKAYLEHAVLGTRLRECTALVNGVEQRTVTEIFGTPDDLKFHSSMTLFAKAAVNFAAQNDVFSVALARYFGGQLDQGTTERLGGAA